MAKRKKATVIPADLEGRQKVLETTLKDLTKRFGEGSIQRLGDSKNLDVEVIPSGSLGLDIAIGVGGIPRGRITEIYGPESSGKTTLCLHVIAEAQKRGGICAFVDMEHALDPRYASLIGVNIDTLYVSQPDTGEQALEITESLVRSGALDIVVVDSVAALVPRAEIEGEMGDSHVGLQARLMSQALRKLAGAVKQSGVALMFTNQLREKVGVLFGCFDHQTEVLMADGNLRRISDLVDGKATDAVMTFNRDTGQFEPKPIANWFKNGVEIDSFDLTDQQIADIEQEYQTIVASYPDDSGVTEISSTPNHEILTPEGYIPAMYLNQGDTIITRYLQTVLSHDLHHLVLGSTLGTARLDSTGEHQAALQQTHLSSDYLAWKAQALGDLVTGFDVDERGHYTLQTAMRVVFKAYDTLIGTPERLTAQHIKMLNPLSLAVWYQDSGVYDADNSQRRYMIDAAIAETDAAALAEAFVMQFGLQAQITAHQIIFSAAQAERFEQIVTPYLHPAMVHKTALTPSVGDCLDVLDFSTTREWRPLQSTIQTIRSERKQGADALRYNIEVEDNANYIVGQTVVHNSPETTSGGRALKFYASVRLDIRRIQSIKSGGDNIGNRTRIKIKKNKVAPPFRETEFDIMFNEGISKIGEILDIGTEIELIEKRGAFYRYNDELLGQGRENAKQYLFENQEMLAEIENRIRAEFGLPTLDEDDEEDDD